MKASDLKRKKVAIIGGGFAGIRLGSDLDPKRFDVILVDRNNYHQFQPLIYQVASSGLEPGSICFPFRKLFRKRRNVLFRIANVRAICPTEKIILTESGSIAYDYLVIAAGTTTNFFGNASLAANAMPMKSVEESIFVRNAILLQLEKIAITNDSKELEKLLNIVVVGGGATGVEVAGVLSEMKRFVIPKDYPELKGKKLNIHLIEASNRLLAALSPEASAASLDFLRSMGVHVILNKRVETFENDEITLNDGEKIATQSVIWVSGVVANTFEGIPLESMGVGKRILVDAQLKVKGMENIYAMGDIACVENDNEYPKGHPQVAQVAIQQARFLARKFKAMNLYDMKTETEQFKYKNLGSMATIGRNKAVADIGRLHMKGFFAWGAWLVIHLRSILGVKNKIFVLLDWMWAYFSYHRSMRLIIFRGKR